MQASIKARQSDRISDEKEVRRAAAKARKVALEREIFEDELYYAEDDEMLSDDVMRHLDRLARNYR